MSKIHRSVDMCLIMCSVLTLLVITIDLYLILTYPLKYFRYRTKRRISMSIGVIWALAILSIGVILANDYIEVVWIRISVPIYWNIPLFVMFFFWIRIAKLALRAQRQTPERHYSVSQRMRHIQESHFIESKVICSGNRSIRNNTNIGQIMNQEKKLLRKKPAADTSTSNEINYSRQSSYIELSDNSRRKTNSIKSMTRRYRATKIAAMIIGHVDSILNYTV